MNVDRWTILDENGSNFVEFTSFIAVDIRNEGQALSYPVEEGGFMNYNKVQTPLDIRVTLATQGEPYDFETILKTLEEFQRDAVKVSVVTPSEFYASMTLEAYTYKHTRESGAGQLTVELSLIEVREVQTRVTTTVITRPKNPTSTGNTNTGKTQPKDDSSLLNDITTRPFGS